MTLIQKSIVDAPSILTEAHRCIGNRAKERDQESERAMASTIAAFNSMYGTNLTETQGWMFMVFLKAARAKAGEFKLDDYVDMAAYAALAGESAIPIPEQLPLTFGDIPEKGIQEHHPRRR